MAIHTLVPIHINGRPYQVSAGISVAAALINADQLQTRIAVGGEPRFALCGMGVCQECRVWINSVQQVLACQTVCQPGMEIQTEGMPA